jgi:hypothetical protein
LMLLPCLCFARKRVLICISRDNILARLSSISRSHELALAQTIHPSLPPEMESSFNQSFNAQKLGWR